MWIRPTVLYLLLVGMMACKSKSKSEVASILGIEEPKEWILVIHPEGCKTCLDSFYSELQILPKESQGAIVLISKSSKKLRLHPLIQDPPIPLYLDDQKLLIKEGIVQMTDQILLFNSDQVFKYQILQYQAVFDQLKTF